MKKKAEFLHFKALEISKNFRKLEAELLDVLIQMEKTKAFKTLGFPSLFQYATQALKLSEANSYNFITVARKAIEIPEIRNQVCQGTISVSQARRIAPVINNTNKASWIQKAVELPQKKLEKEVASINPKLAVPERAKYVAKQRLSLNIGISEKAYLKLKKLQALVSKNQRRPCNLEETLDELMNFYETRKDPVEKAKRVKAKPKKLDVTQHLPQVRRSIPAAIQHQVNLRDHRRCTYKDL